MTIDEAIVHARDVAENRDDICAECRQEHKQLAEWLEELKEKRKMLDEKILLDGIKNYYFEKGYNKAIDEMLEKLNKYYDNVSKETRYPQYDHYCNGIDDCIDIAEQLKAGGK